MENNEEVCVTTRPHRWRRETWWWNEHMEKAIAAKRKAFKAWKTGKGTRASYNAAKRNASAHAVTPILTPSLQKSTALLTSLKERTLMLLVINQ